MKAVLDFINDNNIPEESEVLFQESTNIILEHRCVPAMTVMGRDPQSNNLSMSLTVEKEAQHYLVIHRSSNLEWF